MTTSVDTQCHHEAPRLTGSDPGMSHPHISSDVSSDQTVQKPAWREALQLWLRWNAEYEAVIGRMYEARDDPRQLEALMDQIDQLRFQAVKLSRALLGLNK